MPPVSLAELIAKQVKSTSDFDLRKAFAEMAFNDIVVREIGKLPLVDKIGEYTSGAIQEVATSGEHGATSRTAVDVSSTNKQNQHQTLAASIKPNAFDKEKRYQTPGPILIKTSSDTEEKTSGETESSSDTDT